jgi:hypothetical protein
VRVEAVRVEAAETDGWLLVLESLENTREMHRER